MTGGRREKSRAAEPAPAKAERVLPEPPADQALAGLLGGAWPAWRALLDGQGELRPEWKYYGQKYGWSLKLFRRSRNLCFLTPGEGAFMAAFLFGERDRQRVLEAGLPQALRDEFAAARSYVEGTPIRVQVRGPADLAPVLALLEIKRSPVKARGS